MVIYIGQSLDIETRFRQHIYDSEHLEKRSASGVDFAIAKYGIENFNFSIIEICLPEELDEKEIYWISYYNSYEEGYNRTLGGNSLKYEQHPRAILTEQQVWNIREEYAKGTPRSEAIKPYIEQGISERSLIKVWNNENWIGIHSDVYSEENKNKHKNQSVKSQFVGKSNEQRRYSDEEIKLMKMDYENGMTINAIAKKYHHDNGTIKKYLLGGAPSINTKYRGRKIQNVETKQIFNSISSAAKWAKCGATTITNHLLTDKAAGKIPETNEIAHWIELN